MNGVSFIDIFDPRGRADRAGLAVLDVLLTAAQAGAYAAMLALETPLSGPASLVIHSLLGWTAVAAVSKRLHDLGLGSRPVLIALAGYVLWSLVLTFAAVGAMGETGLAPGSIGLIIVMAGMGLPLAAFLVWIHVAPGEPRDNRFGPVTGAAGFARAYDKRLAASLNPSRMSS